MPNSIYFEYAPPRTWEYFEELCADLFQAMWNDPALVRHGRAGQRQQGVDIVARQGARYPVGIQCKRRAQWPVSRLNSKEIDNEVDEADKFEPTLRAFYIATTAPDDTKLQEHVRKLNDVRRKQKKFEVVLLGWAEIVRRVTLQPEVHAKHFGAVGGVPPSPLLATWFTKDGVLELTGAEFDLAVRELALDLHDHPNGRVLIRQRETDVLVEQIKVLDVAKLTLASRTRRVNLRRLLKRRITLEHAIVRGVIFMLTDPDVSGLVVEVWENDTPALVRAFIEDVLNSDRGVVHPGDREMCLWPPGKKFPEFRIKRYFPEALVPELLKLRDRNRALWNKPLTDSVIELTASLRNFHAVPVILRSIFSELNEGATLDSLRANGWLDVSGWTVEI
jgi:hypothetical protein